MTTEEQTWIFVGHWNDAADAFVEYVLDGDRAGGLFAESASGATQDEALAKIRAEYENQED